MHLRLLLFRRGSIKAAVAVSPAGCPLRRLSAYAGADLPVWELQDKDNTSCSKANTLRRGSTTTLRTVASQAFDSATQLFALPTERSGRESDSERISNRRSDSDAPGRNSGRSDPPTAPQEKVASANGAREKAGSVRGGRCG
eukprot:210317-Prymnesium_polylepis.1